MYYLQKDSKTSFPYDGTFFENKLFSDVEYFELQTKQIYDYQIIITPHKNRSERMAVVTIKWIFKVDNFQQTKGIFKYELVDSYYVDIKTYQNEEKATTELIKYSYRKFSSGFNFDKQIIDIRQPLIVQEQSTIDQIRRELLRQLKSKCG